MKQRRCCLLVVLFFGLTAVVSTLANNAERVEEAEQQKSVSMLADPSVRFFFLLTALSLWVGLVYLAPEVFLSLSLLGVLLSFLVFPSPSPAPPPPSPPPPSQSVAPSVSREEEAATTSLTRANRVVDDSFFYDDSFDRHNRAITLLEQIFLVMAAAVVVLCCTCCCCCCLKCCPAATTQRLIALSVFLFFVILLGGNSHDDDNNNDGAEAEQQQLRQTGKEEGECRLEEEGGQEEESEAKGEGELSLTQFLLTIGGGFMFFVLLFGSCHTRTPYLSHICIFLAALLLLFLFYPDSSPSSPSSSSINITANIIDYSQNVSWSSSFSLSSSSLLSSLPSLSSFSSLNAVFRCFAESVSSEATLKQEHEQPSEEREQQLQRVKEFFHETAPRWIQHNRMVIVLLLVLQLAFIQRQTIRKRRMKGRATTVRPSFFLTFLSVTHHTILFAFFLVCLAFFVADVRLSWLTDGVSCIVLAVQRCMTPLVFLACLLRTLALLIESWRQRLEEKKQQFLPFGYWYFEAVLIFVYWECYAILSPLSSSVVASGLSRFALRLYSTSHFVRYFDPSLQVAATLISALVNHFLCSSPSSSSPSSPFEEPQMASTDASSPSYSSSPYEPASYLTYLAAIVLLLLPSMMLRIAKDDHNAKEKRGQSEQSSFFKHQEDENICKICFEEPIKCVFLTCGHALTCMPCGRGLSQCPLCRQHITRPVEMFKA
ncbi:RING-type domain-containing protein [Balamuthia mandrillaris]